MTKGAFSLFYLNPDMIPTCTAHPFVI